MPISLVILTYNSARHIENLLDSIKSILGKHIRDNTVEVLVFDNNSTDNTLDIVKKFGNFIKIQKSNKNLGYAKGINEAVKHTEGEVIVVINPDARFKRFDKEKVQEKFEKEKDLAVLGFLLEDENGMPEKNAGNFFNPFTFLLYALGLESFATVRFSPKNDREVDFVSGGFVAFAKKHFEKLGGYDEDYFMYVEDMDICYRARKHGLKVAFSNICEAVHKGQGSSNREFAIVNIYKGLVTFYKKNTSRLEFLYAKSLLVVKAALIIFLSTILAKKELKDTYQKALDQIT